MAKKKEDMAEEMAGEMVPEMTTMSVPEMLSSIDFGREDLNMLARKMNEVIAYLHEKE